jgi:hypothetical protein
VLLALTVALTGCGAQAEGGGARGAENGSEADRDMETSASRTPCVAEADPVAGTLPSSFPSSWPLPPSTVVTAVEERDGGVIVSAVSGTAFEEVLTFMNGDVTDAGFAVSSGETEEDDAEADWAGNGFHGRWAIRESACPGETTLQILSTPS